ncbi:MAG: ATP-binding protein, partial [Actinomycetes bacterium]
FERFRRGRPADSSGTDRRSGAGLGLAIVRAIADAHHGSAWVRSVPGDGATFGLDLPADAAYPAHRDTAEPNERKG